MTGRVALVGVALAAAGVLVASYLLAVRLAGDLPVCGPIRGCETVALSSYSEVAGVPVALGGVVFSLALVLLRLAWWRGSRPALVAAYGLGIVGLTAVAWLTYLEIAVIHAICVWCVAYAATVVAGWAVDALALRSPQVA